MVYTFLDAQPRYMNLATSKDCFRWLQKVYEMRHLWMSRDKMGLHTLGSAAYLDSPDKISADFFGVNSSYSSYLHNAQKINPLIFFEFSDLYAILINLIADYLQISSKNISFSPFKALPGFHIFHPHQYYSRSDAHIPHFDMPHMGLDWQEEGLSADINLIDCQTLSYTLPLQIPSTGAGLKLWPVCFLEVKNLGHSDLKKILKDKGVTKYSYNVGDLLIHSGLELHQISPWTFKSDDCDRVTLQGHAVKIVDQWILYW